MRCQVGFRSLVTACCCAAVLVVSQGCGRQIPVDEIDATSSGVTLTSTDSDNALHWPQWRGPEGDGHVTDQQLPTNWSESENVLWTSDVPGRGHSSPIIVGNTVLLASAIEAESKQIALGYDLQTGQKLWQTTVHEGNFPAPREIHKKGTNANGSFASDGNMAVVAFFNNGQIYVSGLDLDGNIVWQKSIGQFVSRFGYAPSPVLYQSWVIVAVDHSAGAYLTALEISTGEIAWRQSRGPISSYSTPLVKTIAGKDQLLITGGDQLASYDPATGKELWSTPCIAASTCGTVVTSGDLIFASGGYPDRETVCINASGEKQWSDSTKVYEPSMLAAGDYLYTVTDSGIAICWDGKTGDVKWKERLGGNFSSSPILVGDLLYVADLKGNTYVFKANPDEYEEVAVNVLGSDSYASPGVADNSLLMRCGFREGGERKEKLIRIGNP